tara:strand:+ start:65 stop:1624 length:1560 start_codon:yes stop_codon:yes gene_type:complete
VVTAELKEAAGELCVGQIGSAVAATTPDKPALTDGDTTLTFGDLNGRVSSLASGLLALGINKGDVVSAYLPNCIAYIIVVLGVARAGAVFSPINPRLKEAEVASILSLARSRAIFTTNDRKTLVHRAVERGGINRPEMVTIDPGQNDGGPTFGELCSTPHVVLPDVSADDYFSLMFTSGTTGQPKGVLATHRARMVWLHKAIDVYGLSQEDVYLGVMPQVHSAGLTFTLMHLHVGGRVHIQRDFDPAEYLALIGRERVTSSLVVPTVLVMVLEALDQGGNQDLQSLRRLVTCGSPLQITTKEGVLDRITPNLFDYYGSTESNSMTVLGPDDQRRKPNSVGPPFEGVEIRITGEDGETMPEGEVGEIWCLNPSVMSRYLDDDDATAAAFTDGWFHTGDLGHVDSDGYLYLVGRSKEIIISGGVNIHPAEVEQVLMSHPAVLDCAIIGLPDTKWGQIVTACVIPRRGANIGLPELQAHCATELADYKKPRRLEILDSIPRNVGGKTLRTELANSLLEAISE